MATTTNYGWTTPDDTALVKDGASAIRTLGSSIDTTTKNLNPSTTLGDIEYRSSTANTNTRLGIGSSGQVLTVAAGVPSWATPSTYTSPLTTKGDLFTRTSSADARLAVGTNGYTLVADSAEATGLKWAAPASGATFVGCILDNTTDISISSSTSTLLTYDTETADTNAFHSTTSNTGRITIPSGYAGKYFFIGSIESSVYNLSTNSGLTSVALRKNGSSIANAFQGNLAGFNTKVCVSWVDVASVGDYYELYAYQNSGGTRTIYYNKTYSCQFAAYYLG